MKLSLSTQDQPMARLLIKFVVLEEDSYYTFAREKQFVSQ